MATTIESLTAELATLDSQRCDATNRNDAFTICLRAAQLAMQAARLASTPEHQTTLKKKCASLLDEAESIKTNNDWTPTEKHTEDLSKTSNVLKSRLPVRKLNEPANTRQILTAEKILLYKASKLNGFTFPPWENDPKSSEFESIDGAIFVDTPELALSDHQRSLMHSWQRAREALPPPGWDCEVIDPSAAIVYSANKIDLVQDAASDCSVVASLSATAARAESGHDWLIGERIWPRNAPNTAPVPSPNGKHVFKLNFNGTWRKVVIDDRLPVSKSDRTLHVVDQNNPTLIWPALVEKAYLKVRGGYDFPGSSSCSDLWTLTGWIPEQIFLQAEDLIPEKLWKRLFRAFQYGDVMITVGTGKLDLKDEKDRRLVSQHSYAVLAMREHPEYGRQFLVKNPWITDKKWKNRAQRAAKRKSVGEVEALPPGSKWHALDSVMYHFENIFLNWNPGLFDYRQDLHFSWAIDKSTPPAQTLLRSPQFSFKIDRPGVVWLLLSRHFNSDIEAVSREPEIIANGETRLSPADNPSGFTSIAVYENGGHRLHIEEVCLERSPFVSSPQVLLRIDMKAKDPVTIVITEQDLPPSNYTFSLSAFSKASMRLDHAVEEYAHPTEVKGKWASDTAGGSTQSAKYYQNPQFRLDVPTATACKALLQCSDPQINIHVAIVRGQGERVYNLRARDIVAQPENYQPNITTAEAKELDPGSYTVICSTYEQAQFGDFTLQINAGSQCTLTPIMKEGAGMITMSLGAVTFGMQNCRMAIPITPRRRIYLSIVAKFIKARHAPNSGITDASTKSSLRITIEFGRGPDKKYLLVSNGGEFSDDKVLRTDRLDLPPAKPGIDLYLVLERLAAKTPGFEELYDVDLRMDVPNGLQVGLWRGWDD